MTSIESPAEHRPWEVDEPDVQVFDATGFPAGHPAEPDLFVRQAEVPGHNQRALEQARVVIVGAGGLGSWAALGLARSGIKHLTIVDHDRFDRTNAHRQLMFAEDMGRHKASAVARNVLPHMIAGGRATAINLPLTEAIERFPLPADVLLVLVDNNECRLMASRWARGQRIPAVFTMLSLGGLRFQSFLQGRFDSDPCLWCALPNLDPDGGAACAAGVVSTCLAAAAQTIFFAHRAVMGWPAGVQFSNWQDFDLTDTTHTHGGIVVRRDNCLRCGAQWLPR